MIQRGSDLKALSGDFVLRGKKLGGELKILGWVA